MAIRLATDWIQIYEAFVSFHRIFEFHIKKFFSRGVENNVNCDYFRQIRPLTVEERAKR